MKAARYNRGGGGDDSQKSTPREVLDLAREKAMYEEIFGSSLVNGSSSRRSSKTNSLFLSDNKPSLNTGGNPLLPSSGSSGGGGGSAAGGFDVTILTRLKTVEQELKELKRKHLEEVAKNKRLESELSSLKAATDDKPAAMAKQLSMQKDLNAKLSMQLVEMELFLADYGLMWVGPNEKREDNEEVGDEEEDAATDGKTDATAEHTMSFEEFRKAIDELNGIIHAEPTQIVTEGDRNRNARFKHASELTDTIVVYFYKNGLFIKRGPFRLCGTSTYHSFVKDVMDGYFPYEFNKEYPEGVLFDLKDMHHEMYRESGSSVADRDTRMSKNQMLNRLPKTVIRNGQVVEVRGEIDAKLSSGDDKGRGSSNSGRTGRDSVVRAVLHVTEEQEEEDDAADSAKVQIKWLDGSLLKANMRASDTVQHLKEKMRSALEKEGREASVAFELRSAYPPRQLTDELTLNEAGLVPNGTVHAKKL